MEEKRSSPRVEFQGRTVVYLGDQQVVAKGSNLSATGILLLAPLAAPLGKTLKLALSLRPSQWLNLEARVVRQVEGATVAWGLEFMRLSRDAAAVLASYVAEQIGLTVGELDAAEPVPTAPGSPRRRVTGPEHPAVGPIPGRRAEPAPAPAPAERSPAAPRATRPTGGFLSALTSRLRAAWRSSGPDADASPPEDSRRTTYALGGSSGPGSRPEAGPTAARRAPSSPSAGPPAARRAPSSPSARPAATGQGPARPEAFPRERKPASEEGLVRRALRRVLTPVGMEIEDVIPPEEDLADRLSGGQQGLPGLYRDALKNMDTEAPSASTLKVIRKPNLRR